MPDEKVPAADPVQAQYERWVYPPRAGDLAALPLMSPDWHYKDLRAWYWLFWPQGDKREDLDILVAGCGSLSAAAQAYLYPQARVFGIDISRTSLEHEAYLQRKHNLSNLTLHHGQLEDVAELGRDFDFIICYGVLHHLADPAAGLRALGRVLRPAGVIDLMVYGKYGRVGVTMLQDLYRVMGVRQDEAGVQVVKDTLAVLPPAHPVQTYRRLAAQDLASDEGLVDTFLHARDRPFSCNDCLDMVREAGLVFQGWKENGFYNPDSHTSPHDPVRGHLHRLGEREKWQAVEIIDGTIAGHWFHVCRPERPAASYRIDLGGPAFLDYRPVPRASQMAPADPANRRPAMISRPPLPPMGLDPIQALVYRHMDGTRPVRSCLAGAGLDVTPENARLAADFFGALWRAGYVLFRLP
jgi:SAM-dependent methyltransferase